MSENKHEHVSLDEMLATAKISIAQAQANRIRAGTALLSFVSAIALATAPAFVIHVWVALWQWLQR